MALELFKTDTRGVSSVIGYLSNLAVLVLVVSAVSFVGTSQFEHVREQQAEKQFEGMNQQVALELQIIDQLNRGGTSAAATITRSVDYPSSVAGVQYRIGFEQLSSSESASEYTKYEVVIKAGKDIEIAAPFETYTPIVTGKYISGGTLHVVRPIATSENINSGYCEVYNSNGRSGIQTISDAQGSSYPPDKCAITIERVE